MRQSRRGCIFCVQGREKPEIAEDNISHVFFLSQILTIMKFTLKTIGYFASWTLYYIIAFSIITISLASLPKTPSPIEILFSSIAFGSPFLISKFIINKFYTGNRKEYHIKAWIVSLFVLTFLYDIGGGFLPINICVSIFNLCIIISLVSILSTKKTELIINDKTTTPNQ